MRASFILLLCLTGCAVRSESMKESLTPIRPGSPGKAPFWNEQAKQFIWAPAFNFSPVAGATSYRFTIGQRSFEAPVPWAPLTPIWADVPVGTAMLRVDALDRPGGALIGSAGTRQFHRAAVFAGPYGKPILPYHESARVALKSVMDEPFVRNWPTTHQPDPAYPLYRYSSKIIGSLLTGCSIYARQSPRPPGADEAIQIGRAAADFLISISGPPGAALESLPPTYHGAKPTERENDNWTMMMTPAEAGQGYLDLYDVTKDRKYRDAARRIAAGYAKLQLPSGTWYLKVDNRTGEPLAPIDLIPSVVISFLDRIVHQYNAPQYAPTLDRAVRWMMENPVRTFNWQAQFDDAKLRGAYQNLSKHEACEFAGYLFQHNDPAKTAIAEEILRFAEDQFVIWSHPPHLPPRGNDQRLARENWFTPSSAEQYAMFEPISGSSAFMIMAYVRAHQATRKPIYLAKAKALANALTVAQQYHHGRYPTRMVREDLAYWINSTINTVRAMRMLAEEIDRAKR